MCSFETHILSLQVHPKLNQMDQDKVAHIYSDLRKESMVSHLNNTERNANEMTGVVSGDEHRNLKM